MNKNAEYDRFRARHHFRPSHAKPTRWARAMSLIDMAWVWIWAADDAMTALVGV